MLVCFLKDLCKKHLLYVLHSISAFLLLLLRVWILCHPHKIHPPLASLIMSVDLLQRTFTNFSHNMNGHISFIKVSLWAIQNYFSQKYFNNLKNKRGVDYESFRNFRQKLCADKFVIFLKRILKLSGNVLCHVLWLYIFLNVTVFTLKGFYMVRTKKTQHTYTSYSLFIQ